MFEEFSEIAGTPGTIDIPDKQEIDESDAPKPSFHLATTNNPDMPEVIVGGVPELWAEKLDSDQGDNKFGIVECCGLVPSSNVLQMAGIDKTEDDIVEYALDNHLCSIRPFHWSQSGGTSKEDVESILEHFGVEADTYEAAEVDYEQMASWIESGQGVIIGHNMCLTIEGQEDSASMWGDKPFADHYTAMTGTIRDPDGNLLGYTVCDSGAHDGMRFISLDQMDVGFKDVLWGDVIVTSNPIHDNGKPLYEAA